MNSMTEVIPAVLADSSSELEDKLAQVAGIAPLVHIDVCDGLFVPRLSWPFTPVDRPRFEAIVREEDGLPFWRELDFEVHVMALHPEKEIEGWLHAGAKRFIVHAETPISIPKLLEAVGDTMEVGLALKLETPLESVASRIESHASDISVLQLMSISKIGFQGSSFDASIVEKIQDARKRFPDLHISVDGGVTLENALSLVAAGADRLVVGSALFKTGDFAGEWVKFREILEQH